MELEILNNDTINTNQSIWDKHVPIIKNGTNYDVYICDEIVEPIEYLELCYILENASSKDTITIHITTSGGSLDTTMMIIKAIRKSEAYIIASLAGSVASAGTMIALTCDEIDADYEVEFMIHYFSGNSGYQKGHEMRARQAFTDRFMPEVFKRIYKGFLTDNELNSVINGQDIYMDGLEVIKRFENNKGIVNS